MAFAPQSRLDTPRTNQLHKRQTTSEATDSPASTLVGNRPTATAQRTVQAMMHRSPQAQRHARLQAQMNDSPRVRAQVQLQAMFDDRSRRMATPHAEVSPGGDPSAPVQREIGDGGVVNLGRDAFHISGRRLKIMGRTESWGGLFY